MRSNKLTIHTVGLVFMKQMKIYKNCEDTMETAHDSCIYNNINILNNSGTIKKHKKEN